jgi:hypothetical protein
MYSSPESRDPDSGGVCSACVRIFQKRDGEMEDPARFKKGFAAEPMAERNPRGRLVARTQGNRFAAPLTIRESRGYISS